MCFFKAAFSEYSLTRTPPGAFATNSGTAGLKTRSRRCARVHGSGRIDNAVLFPTAGQRIGRIVDRDYALGAARAYNDWLAETYLRRDPRFKGIALLPMHDSDAALEELQHAYTRAGHVRCLSPPPVVHLNLGAKPYWPVYGGSGPLGFRWSFTAVAVGPRHGNDERFNRRQCHRPSDVSGDRSGGDGVEQSVRSLPACAWLLKSRPLWFLMALERFSRSFEAGTPVNPRGELLQLPEGQTVADYIFGLVRAGRVVVGIEGGRKRSALRNPSGRRAGVYVSFGLPA